MSQYRVVLFFVFSLTAVAAQSSNQLGILPSLNINKRLPKDWSLNFKAESRQKLYQDNFNYDYLLTDVSIIVANRIRLNTVLAGGYLVRITPDEVKHRTIQQVSITQRHEFFRLAHRLSMDQTLSNLEDTEFRFRYRVSSEIPLEGLTLDPKEFFLKVSNEYLNSLQGKDYDLEIRGAAFLGYALTSNSKMELGLDYRADSFIINNLRNRFWLGINFFQNIP
ncbi:MAG: DUF2490 domain-containing protein, partial [Candidatus Moranbacteria bacterium]|nr:DUF2490 domain-containing protein [Candidatus Moranbacteria bacterium]